jgi:trimeric autotransporter adhesin
MSRRLLFIIGGLIVLSTVGAFVYTMQRKVTPPGLQGQTSATFPVGIAEDGNGNLYVAARTQNRILKISVQNRVMVAAGNGSKGFSGDGGPADRATLSSPMGVAVDYAGNLFIADTGNNRIRRVDAKDNTITTVAGNGSLQGGPSTVATSSGLYEPISVAVDGDDNVYIGGGKTAPIRRIDAITHGTTKVIGTALPGEPFASAPAAGPFWVAVSEHGTVFFSDPTRNTVSEVNEQGNDIHVIVGSALCGFAGDGGPASGALLCFPESLSVGGNKELFIADTANNRIRRVDLSSGTVATVAGDGRAGYAGDGGLALHASLHGPMGIATNRAGDLFIADTGNHCIRRLNAKTGVITTWATARDLELPTSNVNPER